MNGCVSGKRWAAVAWEHCARPDFENKEPFGRLILTDFNFLSCCMVVEKVVGVPRPETVGANK